MTGTDANYEDLLPLWWYNYSQHCDLPVVFADFGMSPFFRAWCEQRGTRVDVGVVKEKAWWEKPFAILRSPFKQTVWIDVDCRVCKPLGELLMPSPELRATVDAWATKNARAKGWATVDEVVYSSGVLVVPHGHPVVTEWARGCFAWRHKARATGDQDILSLAVYNQGVKIATLEPRFNSWRQWRAPLSTDVVAHHSGSRGRKAIRAEAAQNADILLESVRRDAQVIAGADGVASHLPLLSLALSITTGAVLELGCGFCSTPMLHYGCRLVGRELDTVETNPDWLAKLGSFRSRQHRFHYAPTILESPLLDQEWDVALVDHAQALKRTPTADRLRAKSRLVVCHDTQGGRYKDAFANYRYRLDDTRFRAWTSLVSDSVDVRSLTPPDWPPTGHLGG